MNPSRVAVRRMTLADVDRVVEIAQGLQSAPRWGRPAYVEALDTEAALPRMALVAVEVMGEEKTAGGIHQEHTSGAKAHLDFAGVTARLKSCPDTFDTEPRPDTFGTELCPDTFGTKLCSEASSGLRTSSSAGTGEVEGGRVAGFLVASLVPPQAELESIAVDPEFQRRGVARGLFAALASELGPAQVTEVILESRVSNSLALALYAGLGFAEIGRRPRYYADPIEDAVLMRLRLR